MDASAGLLGQTRCQQMFVGLACHVGFRHRMISGVAQLLDHPGEDDR